MEHEFWNVKGCVSCKQVHDAMEFHAFRGYQPIYDAVTFTHWGMCPVNQEPVLGFHYDDNIERTNPDLLFTKYDQSLKTE